MTTLKQRYIADKDFYKNTFKIAWPITISNFISSSMEIIDSIMVSAIGMTTSLSNAANLTEIFYLIMWGMLSGCSIYGAQFFGANDKKNLKRTFGLTVFSGVSLGLLWILIYHLAGKQILAFYLNDPEVVTNGMNYLSVCIYVLPLAVINNAFISFFRCCGQQKISMFASVFSGFVNVFANYCLIFGHFGFKAYGIYGAAYGTLIANLVQLAIYGYFCVTTDVAFLGKPKELFSFDMNFIKEIMERTLPLIINEGIFGFGTTMFAKAFGNLGTDNMTAYYIGNQIYNIFTFAIYGFGGAVAVILGNTLGKNDIKQAIKEKDYLMFISFCITIILVVCIVTFSGPMVSLFNQTDPLIIKNTENVVKVLSVKISMRLFNYVSFAILRSGGATKTIQLLDSGILWLVGIPVAFISVLVFKMENIALVTLLCQAEQLVRLGFLIKEVESNRWAQNLTNV